MPLVDVEQEDVEELQAGRMAFEAHPGEEPSGVTRTMTDTVLAEPRACLDYAEVQGPNSFLPLETLRAPALLVIEAKVGPARLIDTFLFRADGSWGIGRTVSEAEGRNDYAGESDSTRYMGQKVWTKDEDSNSL
jgi:hypothetical protein